MTDYLLQHGTRETPQSEPMREDQVANSAGGYSWEVDDWTKLQRFLILGSEGGSYYASERELTTKNVEVVHKLAKTDGEKLVEAIVTVSEAGRAPKNDPALFALASAISLGDPKTKSAAAEALPRVARIGTHLYHFMAYAKTMRGGGRTLRWAVGNWYDKNPDQLALQAIKYRQRDGWSHRDIMRRSLDSVNMGEVQRDVLGFISGNVNHTWGENEHGRTRLVEAWQPSEITPNLIVGYLKATEAKTAKETAALVREYNLPREALNTDHLGEPVVWEAMLEMGMPLTAMIRNLANMTRIGALDSKEQRKIITEALDNQEAIRKSRVHPLAILVGLSTYASGQGLRGSNTWTPKPDITDALDAAFYLAFDNVEPTGKSHLIALDISGSMDWGTVAGSFLTPREASAALALVTIHVEDDVEVVGFSHTLTPLNLSRRMRLDSAVKEVSRLPMGGTDCALPMLYATQRKLPVDAFVTITDSETWAGRIHPKQALDQYRNTMGRQSRSVVVGMVGNHFSIADPKDKGMMDVVGFDTAAPAVMADFLADRFTIV